MFPALLRAEAGGVPAALMAEYYEQRASEGGFLITESAVVLVDGNGYLGSPGLYDGSQIAGWRLVTDAIHARGGKVFAQIYHAGRQSHQDLRPNRDQPVGPSEVPHGTMAQTSDGWVTATPNRALQAEEIPAIVEGFRAAAQRALAAGFGGVELHGANGYLLGQFLQDGSNRRTDSYGGLFENRARLLLDATGRARKSCVRVLWRGEAGIRPAASRSDGDIECETLSFPKPSGFLINCKSTHLRDGRSLSGPETSHKPVSGSASHRVTHTFLFFKYHIVTYECLDERRAVSEVGSEVGKSV